MVRFDPPSASHRLADVLQARDSFAARQKRQPSARVIVLKGTPRPADAATPQKALAIPLFSDIDSVIEALAETTDH